ncbi:MULTISPECIES: DmpA family aminopeptidase [unclassified Sedimentibacter]|uniref:DmpA family aminopeptidase n=1 Tax=unclassified Sedimentibacter TaxID=2649220 RepID=UPI0027E0B972|nr:P1 family peptidase [Sedimentibacter sp. MB35-C1]WMJ77611.1 P1 family peptidase [Sedimentibacter sp. MB35-C1]
MGLDKDSGITIGSIKKGKRNLITDVKGVKVGHVTLDNGSIKTGVTAIIPKEGNIFKEKVMASCHVINGFGKSAGILQIEELGTIETPIIMTNTLSVGTAMEGLVRYMLRENEDIGNSTGTVNCVVTECNDGKLNDIRGLHVKEEHVFEAIENAGSDFQEGAVGSGTGMVCFGLKGGIGSSSRIVEIDGNDYTIGSIVMSNFGSKKYLTINGDKVGERIKEAQENDQDKGSIIMVIATDIPLSERQLKRISKRSTVALARTGSYLGNGSGDICISFTTANKVNHYSDTKIVDIKMIDENAIEQVFKAVAETVEESIISSMYHADTTTGINNRTIKSLREFL